jgi:hypothetical protein
MRAPAPAPLKFKVQIAADVPPGLYDVRLVNKYGISNPRAFAVGDQPEVNEKEPNNDVDSAQRVALNTVVNGTISPATDVDYFVFAGKKGQRVLLHCQASGIDSKLHPLVQLFDAAGRELAANRGYDGTDALADATLPADGDYTVRLSHFTYTQGSDDHFYRLRVTTAPWIDAVVPPMVVPGQTASLTVYGRNLPGGQPDPTAVVNGRVLERVTVAVNSPADPAAAQRLDYTGHVEPRSSALDGFEYRLRGPGGVSNPYLITYATAPVVLEKEPNNKPEAAQALAVPCEVAGRIDARNDRDWYSFAAKKGDVLGIELFADRIGNPSDLLFALRGPGPAGPDLGEFDDSPVILHPQQFYTRTGDPAEHHFTAPADGSYYLRVSSRESGTQFGPRHLYRLRVTRERPDFRLVVMPPATSRPEAAVVGQNSRQLFDVFVWRLDGFDGPVTLTAEGLPPGVTAPPQVFSGAGAKPGIHEGAFVVTAAPDATPWAGAIRIKGSAVIDGKTLVREARPASVSWALPQQSQTTPVIVRLDRELALAVREPAPFRLTADTAKIVVKQGQKAPLKLTVDRRSDFKGAVAVQTHQRINTQAYGNQQQTFLAFNNNQPLTVADGKADAAAEVSVQANAPPGVYSLVLVGQSQVTGLKDATGKARPAAAVSMPAVPVTVTILPAKVANLTAGVKGSVKAGGTAEVVVRVERLFNYAGDFKVKLVLPKDVSGLAAADAVIPPGATEATLVVPVATGVKPGNLNLVVQATAVIAGDEPSPVVHETKFNLNVVK